MWCGKGVQQEEDRERSARVGVFDPFVRSQATRRDAVRSGQTQTNGAAWSSPAPAYQTELARPRVRARPRPHAHRDRRRTRPDSSKASGDPPLPPPSPAAPHPGPAVPTPTRSSFDLFAGQHRRLGGGQLLITRSRRSRSPRTRLLPSFTWRARLAGWLAASARRPNKTRINRPDRRRLLGFFHPHPFFFSFDTTLTSFGLVQHHQW